MLDDRKMPVVSNVLQMRAVSEVTSRKGRKVTPPNAKNATKKSKFEMMLNKVDDGQITITECIPRMEVAVKKEDLYEHKL